MRKKTMGKELDLEALASQYIWEHLKRMNMNVASLRRWRPASPPDPTKKLVVLFTTLFREDNFSREINVPVAILTEDGILRFLIGSGEVDLKQGGGNPFKSIG